MENFTPIYENPDKELMDEDTTKNFNKYDKYSHSITNQSCSIGNSKIIKYIHLATKKLYQSKLLQH